MNKAEVFITAYQLQYPTIHYRRARCIDAILNSSNCGWKNGEIVHRHFCNEFNNLARRVLNGTAASLDEALRAHYVKLAQKDDTDLTIQICGNLDERVEKYISQTTESAQIPFVYRLNDYARYTAIYHVPDDVKVEWLAVVIEYLGGAINAKIDFDGDSILSESERKFFNRPALTEAQEKMAEDVLKEVLAEEGKVYKHRSVEQRKKDLEDWEQHHSPRARARQANQDNLKSREIAANIMEELKGRGLLKV